MFLLKILAKKIIKREFDIAVHSWKDLPLDPSNETEIAGTLDRGDLEIFWLLRKKPQRWQGKRA